MISSKNFLLALSIFMFISPFFIFANGGDQRVVESTYLINLSRAPFTPRVGVKTSFLASFVNIQKNKLISEDLVARVRIARLGGRGGDTREFIFEQKDMKVNGGVLDFSYTFADPGLHEIFLDFSFADNSGKVYESPDFLLDVQKPEISGKINLSILIGIIAALIGGIAGWAMARRST